MKINFVKTKAIRDHRSKLCNPAADVLLEAINALSSQCRQLRQSLDKIDFSSKLCDIGRFQWWLLETACFFNPFSTIGENGIWKSKSFLSEDAEVLACRLWIKGTDEMRAILSIKDINIMMSITICFRGVSAQKWKMKR